MEIKRKNGEVLIEVQGETLCGADLREADLRGAKGVISFGPIGSERRIAFAYIDGGVQTRIGCFSGDHNAAIAAIQEKYGPHSTYEIMLRTAVWALAEANQA